MKIHGDCPNCKEKVSFDIDKLEVKAPKVDIATTDFTSQLKAPDLKEYMQKSKLMGDLAKAKGGGKFQPRRYQVLTTYDNAGTPQYERYDKQTNELTPIKARAYDPKYGIDPDTGVLMDKKKTLERKAKEQKEGIADDPTKIKFPKDEKVVQDYQKSMRSNKGYSEAADNISKISELKDKALRAQKNPIALAQLGAEVASLYENGRLTDEDVKRYIKDHSLQQTIMDLGSRAYEGTLTATTAKNIAKELSAKHNDYKKRIVSHVDRTAKRGYGLLEDKNIKLENFKEFLYPGISSLNSKKSIVKKQYSKKRNKTKITYDDGTQEIVDGRR